MYVSIPPSAIIMLVVIICNCILSFGKSIVSKKLSILLSSLLSLLGILGMVIVPLQFNERLNRYTSLHSSRSDFILWAREKFYFYAIMLWASVIVAILILLLGLILNKSRSNIVWRYINLIVISLMLMSFILGIGYSLTTINKFINIGSYIFNLSSAGFFTLYLPLVIKKFLILKDRK